MWAPTFPDHECRLKSHLLKSADMTSHCQRNYHMQNVLPMQFTKQSQKVPAEIPYMIYVFMKICFVLIEEIALILCLRDQHSLSYIYLNCFLLVFLTPSMARSGPQPLFLWYILHNNHTEHTGNAVYCIIPSVLPGTAVRSTDECHRSILNLLHLH